MTGPGINKAIVMDIHY